MRRTACMKQSRCKTLSAAKHRQKENHSALLQLVAHEPSTAWVLGAGAYLRRREKYGLKIHLKVDLRLRSTKRWIYASNHCSWTCSSKVSTHPKMQYMPRVDGIRRRKPQKENAKKMAVLRVPQAQVRLQQVRRCRRRRNISQALETVQHEVAGASGKAQCSADMPF